MRKKITVKLAIPERKYVKTYHDFLNNTFLSTEEQMIFIILKSFIDFKDDSGEVFPSMETICKMAKMSEKRARKNIKSLEKKGIVKKIRRGLSKTNIYTIADCPTMWTCDNVKDVVAIVNNQGVKPMTAEEHIAELEHMGYTVQIKEREPEALQADQSNNDSSTQLNIFTGLNNTTNMIENQDLERYTITQIHQLFDYDIMLQEQPDLQQDIDTVMSILHTAMNTAKSTIRIAGQDKPTMTVIGKLMKLDKNSILYAIKKYQEQTEKIKNPTAYMLTILYNAPEQYHLDMKNQISNETAKIDRSQDNKINPDKEQSNKSSFHNFTQRTYDYEALEQELLNR